MNKVVVVSLLLLVFLGIGAYLLWLTSPFYAFQQAGLGIVNHDLAAFNSAVDTRNVIADAIDQAVLTPVRTTTGLTRIQSEAAQKVAKFIETTGVSVAVEKVDSFVAADPKRLPAQKVDNHIGVGENGTNANTGSSPVGGEAIDRFMAALAERPNSLAGKVVSCCKHENSRSIKDLLASYNLDSANFKGVAFKQPDSETFVATATFSPKNEVDINVKSNKTAAGDSIAVSANYNFDKESEINIAIELKKSAPAGWRISRIANLAAVLLQLDPQYENDIQNGLRSSLSGLSVLKVERAVLREAGKLLQLPFVKRAASEAKERIEFEGGKPEADVRAAKRLGQDILNRPQVKDKLSRYRRWQEKMDSLP